MAQCCKHTGKQARDLAGGQGATRRMRARWVAEAHWKDRRSALVPEASAASSSQTSAVRPWSACKRAKGIGVGYSCCQAH